jgi:hypothetical protein
MNESFKHSSPSFHCPDSSWKASPLGSDEGMVRRRKRELCISDITLLLAIALARQICHLEEIKMLNYQ